MTRWQIFSAVALRKLPELRPQFDVIESKVQQIFDKYAVATSKLSQFEMRHLEETKAKDNEDSEMIITETAQDKLDRWVKEKSEFTPGKYDDRLTKIQYLFIQSKFGTDIKDQWLLPQAIYDSEQDDNLLDAARRSLRESLNIVNGYRIVSKVPSSMIAFRYPKKVAKLTGYDGAKVFYLKAHLDYPSPLVTKAVDSNANDRLSWLTLDEASKVVERRYLCGLKKGAFSEERVDTDLVLGKAAKYAKDLHAKQEKLVAERKNIHVQ